MHYFLWIGRMRMPFALIGASLVCLSARASEELFERRIRPVLVETCLPCHGGDKTESGLRVDSRGGLLTGGERGAAIVPGKSGESLLVLAIGRKHDDLAMPPAKRLPAE